MTRRSIALALLLSALTFGQAAPPKVLLFFSLNVESDHVLFAAEAI
jgi:hypothetical protein